MLNPLLTIEQFEVRLKEKIEWKNNEPRILNFIWNPISVNQKDKLTWSGFITE